MALSDAARRIRAFLDSTRAESEEEGNRRVYTYNVADLEDIYYDEISGYPSRHWGTAFVAAVAGQLSFVQLLNPANSGVDIVPDMIIIGTGTTGIVEIRLGPSGGAVVTSMGRRDSRGAGTTIGQVRQGTEVAAAGALRTQARCVAGTPLILTHKDFCILGSSIALQIEHTTANATLDASFWWKEIQPGRFRSA